MFNQVVQKQFLKHELKTYFWTLSIIYIYSVHTCYITRNIISVNRILDGKSEYNRLLGRNSCR